MGFFKTEDALCVATSPHSGSEGSIRGRLSLTSPSGVFTEATVTQTARGAQEKSLCKMQRGNMLRKQ